MATYRYIQLLVSRLGLPVSHSGANVIQPGWSGEPRVSLILATAQCRPLSTIARTRST